MLERIFMTGDGLDAIRIALALLTLASAIAYQAIEHRPPSALRTGLKTASIGLLVPLPLLAGTALPFILLAAAFLFSALGDLFLAMKGDKRNFPRGLGCFLASHLFYIAVMLPLASAPDTLALKATSLAVGIGALALYWSLAPTLGRMKLPVGAYLVVILAMALTALAVPAGAPWLGLGAVLFVISDSAIALDKFRTPLPWRGPIVWITYYVGQALMAASLLALLMS